MAKSWVTPKDPDERLDYFINWEARLDGDTIDDSDWSLDASADPDDLVIDEVTVDGDKTYVWFTGGTVGQTYEVLNRITTVGGRIMDQTMKLKIKAK